MLIEFKFRNFLSFKNETTFTMTTVKSFNEHTENNVITGEIDLLKSAAVYGNNASGKSNFISAMESMKGIIHESFSNSLKKDDDKPDHNFQFRLNESSENADTMFEVSFLLDEVIYRYGFEINGHAIKREWLYKNIERENYLYLRSAEEFKINKNSFTEGLKYKDDVNPNVLFLSHLAQNNQKISRQVFSWFSNLLVYSDLLENQVSRYTANLLQNEINFRNWISHVLKYLEIINIEASEEKGKILTYHNRYDKDNLLVDSIPFIMSDMESHGTKKLINILGPIYMTLRNGGILFIDEMDSKLHSNMSRKLLRLFNEFNRFGAQLVFTGHDTSLLDKDILRRDQIWFVNKDQFGVSELYSLSDFNSKTVRNTSAYDKKYLGNEFGSSDTVELNQKLVDLIYG